MYRAMIVDDERLIREGLAGLIDWNACGFGIVAVSPDAYDALARFDDTKPDLLITDIRMPGMDGLHLIETLRQRSPDLRVLILSGYAEFDYAKRALLSRVDGYLLKPVEEDELIALLNRIKGELDQKRAEAGMDDAGRGREDFISALADGGLDQDPTLGIRATRYGLDWNQYQVLLIEPRTTDPGDAVMLARRLLANGLDGRRTGLMFPMGRRIGILLRQAWNKPAALGQLRQELVRILAPAALEFDAAIGGAVDDLAGIAGSCRQAETRLARVFFSKDEQIIATDPAPADVQRTDGAASWDRAAAVERLGFALDARNPQALSRVLDEAAAAMQAAGLGEGEIKSGFANLAGDLIGHWQKSHPDDTAVRTGLGDWIAGIYRQNRLENLKTYLLERLADLLASGDPAGADQLVARILDIIEGHYAENLRLESLAEAFGYNSSYLGKVFRARCGEYFNNRLDKVRIGKAKTFLAQGMRVFQVAQLVGYADADYFQQKFKKCTGSTPSAWRAENCRRPSGPPEAPDRIQG